MAPLKGRARFQSDLEVAAEKSHVNISAIKKGEVEDEFTFLFSHSDLPEPSQFEIHVQPQDIGGYPSDNAFLVYTIDDVPPGIARVLEDSMSDTSGMKVGELLANISQRLQAVLRNDDPGTEDDASMMENTSELDADYPDSSDEDMPFEYDDDVYDNFGTDEVTAQVESQPMESPPLPVQQRMRRDLQSVCRTGLYVGKICGFGDNARENIISISIRANLLGLSKDTHDAWDIAPSDYVVLLIAYKQTYRTFEDIIEMPANHQYLRFSLRKCKKKKPSCEEAIACFPASVAENISSPLVGVTGLSHIFIGKSIDEFMDLDFVSMLKLRNFYGGTWDSAKQILRSKVTNTPMDQSEQPPARDKDNREGQMEHDSEVELPPFLIPDHMLSSEENQEKSLPLIVAQFAFRYLVRCIDYCMVCHERLAENFEALRPYVCSNPLCLDQYVNLGLGSSVNHEIINHPNVVDLLISFCYTSLTTHAAGRISIRDFPRGLRTKVPKIRLSIPIIDKEKHRYVDVPGGVLVDPIKVQFNWENSTATTVSSKEVDDVPLEVGQLVVISTVSCPSYYEPELALLHHARIESVRHQEGEGLVLGLHIVSRHTLPSRMSQMAISDGEGFKDSFQCPHTGHLVLCDDQLDDIEEHEKAFSMIIILAALPSVKDMREYLMRNQQLAKWNRMTQAGVDLVRWILASNRSHIVQVTEDHEKISGVDGWIQFRFIQGSPEKEILFKQALQGVDEPRKTLVAWHGSSLSNWHSIIRGGLDYSVTQNARAYGDGIYFAREFDVSFGYTWQRGTEAIWPRSSLQIQNVVGLSELVNAPHQFRAFKPFYVVQHCHWTQHRYLFTKSDGNNYHEGNKSTKNTKQEERGKVPEFVQDPKWEAMGPGNNKLFIPKYAIPSVRGELSEDKGSSTNNTEEDGMISSDEDEEDLKFIFHDDGTPKKEETYETDFRPGTLDFSKVPQLEAPSYENNAALKTLGQEIKKLQKVQATTPLHQLGWYIDFDKISNMFQWIVELHSFDSDLPLAQDMKKAGLTSVVLEIRFTRGYPMSPPFVRVIQPRFLPFASGGGGHVTAGGALCMELLTNTGWSPANSMESILLQVRLAICSTDPQPARLESHDQRQYGIGEAIEAYTRAARAHGWEIPKDLQDMIIS
ncbi:hypothetical protein GGS26DRAFT_600222 [Hypomontagnella submonticulosa]|nr:hypothetical protein GGS26DRAFT_600222 [Hypomontagnella submonticulosa]